MFERFHQRWLKNKLQKEGFFNERGEYELLTMIFESLEKWNEDNEPTRISYFIEMAIRVARENSIHCNDEHIRRLVEGALKDNSITGLGMGPVAQRSEQTTHNR